MKIVVSACLLGRNCKYSGGNNYDPRVAAFVEGRDVIAVCPEECLGVPRVPMEIVDGILINRDGETVDRAVREQVERILGELKSQEIECCVLKSRSPTCGVKQVYDGSFSGRLVDGMGVLAQAMKDAGYPVIDAEEVSDFRFSAGAVRVAPLTAEDDTAVIRLLTDPLVTCYYMVPDFADAEAAAALSRRLLALSRKSKPYVAGIYLDGVCIGILNETERLHGCIELGLAIHSDYQGRGYGTAVLAGAAEFLLNHGFDQVLAGAFVENKASIRAMEKSGMTRLDRQETITYRGIDHDCVYYVRTK